MPPTYTSPATGSLGLLRTELNGAKSQWEFLLDRIMNGYKDAYNLHKEALEKLEARVKEDTKSELGALMFILSVVSVGFSGGFVGALVAPWIEKAGEIGFKHALREGAKDIVKHGTSGAIEGAIKRIEKETEDKGPRSPYKPVVKETFDAYLDKKEEFDGCFARFNKFVDTLQEESDKAQWSIQTGQAILRHFRWSLPVLRDKPDPDKDLPPREKVAKAAELAMWVQWAQPRDWNWWNEEFKVLDQGPPSLPERIIDEVERSRDARNDRYKLAVHHVDQLDDVYSRLVALGKRNEVVSMWPKPWLGSFAKFSGNLDLRKLKKLKLGAMPDLPFEKMKKLDFGVQTTLQLRGQFLDSLRDHRPYYKK